MGITVLLAGSAPGDRKLEKSLLENEPDIEVAKKCGNPNLVYMAGNA